MNPYERRKAITRTNTLLLAAILGGVLVLSGVVSINLSTLPGGGTTAPPSGQTCLGSYKLPVGYECVTSATLTFALNDPLATGTISSATITVYNPDGTGGSDSGTTSSGTYTTAGKYSTGQSIVAEIQKSGLITYFQSLTVPPAQITATAVTNLQVPVFDTSLGSWSNTVLINPGGSTFSTGQTYYFSEQTTAQTSVQVSWTLSESTNNAGWADSRDIFNQFTRQLVFVASDGGDGIQGITGYGTKEAGGTTTYYLFTIPSGVTATYQPDGVTLKGWTVAASGATQYTNSNAQTSTGGTYTFSFNLNRNSETAGTQATWSFKLWYAASATFSTNGVYNLGPPATQSGSTFTGYFTA